MHYLPYYSHSFIHSFLLLMPIMFWTSSCIERLYIWELSLKISEASNRLHAQNDNFYILIGAVLSGLIRERITSIITESSMSLSPAVSPSACSLKMSSGLLYGLRASRCVTLSLSGRSCKSPVFFLFEVYTPFFGLDAPTPLVMLLRRGRDECRGLVRLASAGAGARTVTFLPARKQEISHQKQRQKYLQKKPCGVQSSWAQVSII